MSERVDPERIMGELEEVRSSAEGTEFTVIFPNEVIEALNWLANRGEAGDKPDFDPHILVKVCVATALISEIKTIAGLDHAYNELNHMNPKSDGDIDSAVDDEAPALVRELYWDFRDMSAKQSRDETSGPVIVHRRPTN